MKLELRISNYDLLDEYLKRDIDIIGFGDEYCEWAIFNVPKLKEVVKKNAGGRKDRSSCDIIYHKRMF